MKDLQKEILSRHEITVRSYEGITVKSIPEFLGKISDITNKKEGSIIQLMDADYLCGRKHLNQAIAQAFKSFDEKQNFAKDVGLEVCVRASAQKQISQAIKTLGIKEKSDITVVYIDTVSGQIDETEKLLGKRNDELLDDYDDELLIKTYDLSLEGDIVCQINEKIALLAIKN